MGRSTPWFTRYFVFVCFDKGETNSWVFRKWSKIRLVNWPTDLWQNNIGYTFIFSKLDSRNKLCSDLEKCYFEIHVYIPILKSHERNWLNEVCGQGLVHNQLARYVYNTQIVLTQLTSFGCTNKGFRTFRKLNPPRQIYGVLYKVWWGRL